MKDHRILNTATRLSLFGLLLAMTLGTEIRAADISGKTTVYREGSKKRVHVAECRRYKRKDPGTFTSMTFSEATAKGLEFCSRCPSSAKATAPKAEGTTENPTVYREGNKKRVHVAQCRRYKRNDPNVFTSMTFSEAKSKGLDLCSRCPSSAKTQEEDLPESWVNPAPAELPQVPFSPSPKAPLVAKGSDGSLVYKAYSSKNDRIVDFSYAGYKKSEVPLPDVQVMITLEPGNSSPRQVGNMKYPLGQDDTQRIQAALDKVTQMPRQGDGSRGAVLLKAGTYYISGSLTVGDGAVLRGEGDDENGTVLIMNAQEEKSTAINLRGASGVEKIEGTSVSRMMDDYVPTGVMSVRVTDASQFKPGDFVQIRKMVNDAWIDTLGMGQRLRHIRAGREGLKKRPWKPEAYRFRLLRQVTSVSGDTITFDMPLIQSFDKKHGGGEVYKVDYSGAGRNGGIEHLRMVSNYDTTVRDESKSSYFRNYRSAISISNYTDGWVRGVTGMHLSFATVRLSGGSRQITVRDSNYLQPFGPKRGGNRYAFMVGGGTGNLFYNCYSEDARHCFAGGSRTQGPFVFLECTSDRGGQSEPHHRWGTAFLYDNVSTKDGTLAAINRGDSGSGHGWSAANTIFWNCDAGSIIVMDPETEGENNFAFGFMGGETDPDRVERSIRYANNRAGYWGTPQQGKFYGHSIAGSGHIENPSSPMPIPSLFQQQLIDRIGEAQAQKVLQ